MLELSNLCHCVQHPWKLTSRDFWSSRNKESHFLSKNVFWRNAVGYLRNGECWELSNLCHCVQHPENLLVGISGALGTKESHFLSCGVSQKCRAFKPLSKCCRDFCISEMVNEYELSNLCHCVQHPWKLTSRDFWSSRNKESHFLSKMCFEKMLWGISEMVNARAFKPLPLCSAHLKTY